jgi:DNA-binding winged helix-turn-helix (wHTH) protein
MSTLPIEAIGAGSAHREVTAFGPFRLSPVARTLEKNGEPVKLGSRALDILIVLVERAGEIVGHKELMARAWRGLVVDPGNLRVHIAGLRKTLDEGGPYIHNIPSQGYCFVAPISRAGGDRMQPTDWQRAATLPPPLVRMLGREEMIREIMANLLSYRLVTIGTPAASNARGTVHGSW